MSLCSNSQARKSSQASLFIYLNQAIQTMGNPIVTISGSDMLSQPSTVGHGPEYTDGLLGTMSKEGTMKAVYFKIQASSNVMKTEGNVYNLL